MSADAPAPHGEDLTFEVECTSSQAARFGAVHPVAVHSDWTVTTPHDLEAERVSQALGGYSSCLALVDRVVPVYRHVVRIMMRTEELQRDDEGSWLNTPAPLCTMADAHATLAQAIRHEIDPVHLAGRIGVPVCHVDAVLQAAQDAWFDAAVPGIVTGGREGHEQLWRAGIHPDAAFALARQLPPAALPMPGRAFIDATYSGVDNAWFRSVVELFPTPDFAAWAAWQSDSGASPTIEGMTELRDAGLDAGTAVQALMHRVDAAAIIELAEAERLTVPHAARWLATWAAAGCRPGAEHYRVLAKARVLGVVPRRHAIYELRQKASTHEGRGLSATEAGVMLALQPNPARILEAVRHGIRTSTSPKFLDYTPSGRTR